MMDEQSRELLDRAHAVVEERDALLRDRLEWKERVERDAYLAEQAGRETAERERDALRTLVTAAGAVISAIGCECACACDEDHDDDCEGPCSVCRIADALQPSRGAR